MSTAIARDALWSLGASVSPQDVREYLGSRGWAPFPSRRGDAAIFRRPGEEATEVYVPLDRALADYGEAMASVARHIAVLETRSTESVLRDLLRPRKDILRFALEAPALAAGSVGLLTGAALLNGARKALLASACSVEKPRAFHPRMSLAEAESFVRGCELGQTEIGSFVLTIETPLQTDPQLTSGEAPFGRRATTYLLRATAHLAAAIRAGEPTRVIEPREGSPVVSANLCDALVEMMPADESADLRLRSSWSPIVAPPADTPTTAYFERGMFEEVEKLGQRLRPSRGPRPAQFVGTVAKLAGEPGAEGRVEGEVELQLQVDDELLTARVVLGADDYRSAARAHLEQLFVKIRGVLHRGTRLHRLAEPSEFTVLDE